MKMEKNSITLKELESLGKISVSVDSGVLPDRTRENAKRVHHNNFKEWGHVVKIRPSDITFKLHQTKQLEYHPTLWPDKPLVSIIIENEIPYSASNDGFFKNVRMGINYYRISMNPEKRVNDIRTQDKFAIEVRRL